MRRRKILKSIAAGSIAGMSIGTAAGSRTAGGRRRIEEVDALYVLRGGETVRTVEDPSLRDLRHTQESLAADEIIVNYEVEPTCYTHCKTDCDVACPDGGCEWAATCADTKYCCGLEEQ